MNKKDLAAMAALPPDQRKKLLRAVKTAGEVIDNLTHEAATPLVAVSLYKSCTPANTTGGKQFVRELLGDAGVEIVQINDRSPFTGRLLETPGKKS